MKNIVFVTLTALLLAACQPGQDVNEPDDVELEATAEVEQAPKPVRRRYQPRERPDPEPEPEALTSQRELVPGFIEGRLEQPGPGLSLMIDASSKDAFHQSLELVATETSEEQYVSLASAIRMLEAYDLEASANPDGLLPVIDGLTGDEIIERAHSMRSR